MKSLKQDRRSLRTHRLLAEALISLLQEHRYTDLTVQDIIDRANIGRTTFYAHYYDKDDLLASEMERVIAVMSEHLTAEVTNHLLPIPSLGMFQHLQEQQALYRALVSGHAIDVVITTVKARLIAHVEQHYRQKHPKPSDELKIRITAQATVGSFVTLLQWWMENDILLSPEQMDNYFQQLTAPGVRAVLHMND